MTPELAWLARTVVMTAFMWIPYVLNRMLEQGILGAMGNPNYETKVKAAWAERASHAHANAVENLVVFAPLVLIAAISGISSPQTIAACQLYFFARLAHYLIYTFGIPYLRTVSFIAGFIAQITMAIAIFKGVA